MNNLTDKELQEKARELRNEYQRNWRKENQEKIKEYNQRYWEKKAKEELKGDKQMLEYLKEMRAASDSYIKLEEKLNTEIEEIKNKYINLIDKTGMTEEIEEVEKKLDMAKEKAINDIKNISSKAIKTVREWGRPTSESIKDIGILQLDLNEDEIIDLLDYHKNNPVMVKELQKYARNKGMKKAPYLQYDTVENRIEKIKNVQDIILKGISSNHVYWNMYIRNKEAMDKLIEPIGG